MYRIPTHQQLTSRADEVEQKTSELTQKDLLRFLWPAVEQSCEGIAIIDLEGDLLYLNSAFAKKHGYTPDELLGKKISVFHTARQMTSVEEANERVKTTGAFKGELWHLRRDGTVFPGLMHNSLIKDERDRPIGILGTLQDISDIKKNEEALQKAHNKLEDQVEERTRELAIKNRQLEEVNIALKVLLRKKDEDKKQLEDNILSNVNKLILPYIGKVKKNNVDEDKKFYMEILESNFKEIISPFSKKISSTDINLTPAEIQVADFVKNGRRTKEIADCLNLSVKTIESHREGIRKKLGIKNKKKNLRSYLLSLQ